MKRIKMVSLVLLAVFLFLAAGTVDKVKPGDLTIEELYRVKPFQGTTARAIQFAESGKYVAYLWNPFGERGTDLYVCETATGQTRRVTSLDIMRQFDPPLDTERFLKKAAQKDREDELQQTLHEAEKAYLEGKTEDLGRFEREQIEQLKKETAEKKAKEEAEKKAEDEERKQEEARLKEKLKQWEQSKAGAAGQQEKKDEAGQVKEGEAEKKDESGKTEEQKENGKDVKKDGKKDEEKEEWEWRDELKKKREKDAVKPGDLYPGVNLYVWARKADELIFQYRGDLYRYRPAVQQLERLTMSDRRENILDYHADDQGYYFADGEAVFTVRFGSSLVKQINHDLFAEEEKDKFKITNTKVSPDGKWMSILAEKREGPDAEKEVQIMSFKERFSQARKVKRQMPDDKRNEPAFRLYIRPVPAGDNFGAQPEPVFKVPGGDVWYEFSGIRWSEDGSRYAFSTWQREKQVLRVYLGQASETAKPEMIYENVGNVGHEVSRAVNPGFTPDGKKIVVILDEDGFRNPYVIDVTTKECRQLIKGNFESFPVVEFTRDSRYLFVLSDREDPSMSSIYKVSLETGEMTRTGKPGGMHRSSAVSKDGKWMASVFGNWGQRPELHLLETGRPGEKILTDSHDRTFEKYNLIKPELFKYDNRHGDKISGMVFKPAGWRSGDRRPCVVYVYGGPLGTGHTVESDTYNTAAYIFPMYMAAKYGYVMVCIDPRGQSGYGRNFADANYEKAGLPQVEDLEDLVKFMSQGFGVDSSRVGLHGWSFGGFQTQMTMYTSPDTFACGIAGAGPTEWENYNSWYAGGTIGKSVRGKPALRKYSLIPLAKNLKKPLLLMHGMDDDNVLYQDTVNVYRALLEYGKEALVDLFLDPEGGHGMGGAVLTKGRFKKYESFFLQHLGKGAVQP